jgi:hypothetical protein
MGWRDVGDGKLGMCDLVNAIIGRLASYYGGSSAMKTYRFDASENRGQQFWPGRAVAFQVSSDYLTPAVILVIREHILVHGAVQGGLAQDGIASLHLHLSHINGGGGCEVKTVWRVVPSASDTDAQTPSQNPRFTLWLLAGCCHCCNYPYCNGRHQTKATLAFLSHVAVAQAWRLMPSCPRRLPFSFEHIRRPVESFYISWVEEQAITQ